jgi:hypothetical protein
LTESLAASANKLAAPAKELEDMLSGVREKMQAMSTVTSVFEAARLKKAQFELPNSSPRVLESSETRMLRETVKAIDELIDEVVATRLVQERHVAILEAQDKQSAWTFKISIFACALALVAAVAALTGPVILVP